jgi:hypothetical protein
MKRHFAFVAGPLVVTAALAWSGAASAQQATQTTVAAQPAHAETVYEGPNRGMIGSGLVMFGLAYVPAVIVASQSTLDADHHLYVPVAGPWMNLSERPQCNSARAACDQETSNRVLLVVDGVFQGVGALTTFIGLVTTERETRTVTTRTATDKPSIHFTPASMGAGGVGAAAFGTF